MGEDFEDVILEPFDGEILYEGFKVSYRTT